jgi:predicted dehydrogenase
MAISTPAATHYEMVKQSLIEGKNVFVEKCQG